MQLSEQPFRVSQNNHSGSTELRSAALLRQRNNCTLTYAQQRGNGGLVRRETPTTSQKGDWCLVSTEQRYIYHKIPKCASNAISNGLERFGGEPPTGYSNCFSDKVQALRRGDWFSFAFVREPLARWVSGYHFVKG